MKLKDIQAMADKDLKISQDQLHEISMDVPYLHNKYYKHLSEARLALKLIEAGYNKLYKEKYNYFSVDYSILLDRKEIPIYIAADPDIVQADNKVFLQKEKIKYLEAIIDNISRISFNVRNAIEFIKFTHGE